ncbi:uncharacterized protein LOC123313020 [Coccinella septempunctata]|uniref:uncharacterized protein LOC123313020 n=1 Tax=Coccinella septempunctata TaxID=41139 RepID=UPI001D073316|nr:uncharacterized protein LOC123313020 [Coccinella septempunctata]
MNVIAKLVNAVERRPTLWIPSKTARWEDVADEVFGSDYVDWLVDDTIEEKALYCQEEWELLRDQYMNYMDFLDRNIHTKQKCYRDGHVFKPMVLDFLGVPSNRAARLVEATENGNSIPRDTRYRYDKAEEYSSEDKMMIREFFRKRTLPSIIADMIWQEFLENGKPSVAYDPEAEAEDVVQHNGIWSTPDMEAMVRDILKTPDSDLGSHRE